MPCHNQRTDRPNSFLSHLRTKEDVKLLLVGIDWPYLTIWLGMVMESEVRSQRPEGRGQKIRDVRGQVIYVISSVVSDQ